MENYIDGYKDGYRDGYNAALKDLKENLPPEIKQKMMEDGAQPQWWPFW